MAICELLFFKEIPPKVTMNEAIELAKLFSTSRSGQFVNGVLDAVLNDMKAAGELAEIRPRPVRGKRHNPRQQAQGTTFNELLNLLPTSMPDAPDRSFGRSSSASFPAGEYFPGPFSTSRTRHFPSLS